MRNVADMLEAFAAAKVVPGDKAREAMFAAIVREATRATPKAIAEVLHGLGSARGVGAGLQGADALTRRVVCQVGRGGGEGGSQDGREGNRGRAVLLRLRQAEQRTPRRRQGGARRGCHPRGFADVPEDVASVLVGYHRAGAAPEASGLLQKIAKFSDPSDAVDALAVFTSKRVKPAATTREALAKAVVNAAPRCEPGASSRRSTPSPTLGARPCLRPPATPSAARCSDSNPRWTPRGPPRHPRLAPSARRPSATRSAPFAERASRRRTASRRVGSRRRSRGAPVHPQEHRRDAGGVRRRRGIPAVVRRVRVRRRLRPGGGEHGRGRNRRRRGRLRVGARVRQADGDGAIGARRRRREGGAADVRARRRVRGEGVRGLRRGRAWARVRRAAVEGGVGDGGVDAPDGRSVDAGGDQADGSGRSDGHEDDGARAGGGGGGDGRGGERPAKVADGQGEARGSERGRDREMRVEILGDAYIRL